MLLWHGAQDNIGVWQGIHAWGFFLPGSSTSLGKEELNQGIEVDIETPMLTLTPMPTLSLTLKLSLTLRLTQTQANTAGQTFRKESIPSKMHRALPTDHDREKPFWARSTPKLTVSVTVR